MSIRRLRSRSAANMTPLPFASKLASKAAAARAGDGSTRERQAIRSSEPAPALCPMLTITLSSPSSS